MDAETLKELLQTALECEKEYQEAKDALEIARQDSTKAENAAIASWRIYKRALVEIENSSTILSGVTI